MRSPKEAGSLGLGISRVGGYRGRGRVWGKEGTKRCDSRPDMSDMICRYGHTVVVALIFDIWTTAGDGGKLM